MIASTAAVLALGAWLGCILFQSAIVAPVVFGTLEMDGARRVLRTLFPRFFKLGMALGAAAALAVLLSGNVQQHALELALIVAMVTATGFALWLVPSINAAGDAGEAGRTQFKRLHGLSVLLTLAVMVGCIAVSALLVAGLREPLA